jgi:uncharacterized protein YmfQ (DUF2313 family)
MGWWTATKDDYAAALKRLSPRGRLFGVLSTGLTALYKGIGTPFADLHNRLGAILDEAHPGTANLTLNQWLAEYGLPEPGMALPPTTAERQALLLAKITTTRGQSKARMLAICAACGVDPVTITEWWAAGWPQDWKVSAPDDVIVARYTTAKFGDKFTAFTGPGLAMQQQLERAKPAHTTITWTD